MHVEQILFAIFVLLTVAALFMALSAFGSGAGSAPPGVVFFGGRATFSEALWRS